MSRDIWFISDTHWNHANILNFTIEDGSKVRPEFTNSNEMDEFMLENWNSRVKPQDKIWHLGDVYFGQFEYYRDNIHSKLNGHKRLLLGNHDENDLLSRLFQKVQLIRRFDELDFVCSHIPLHTFSCYNHRKNSTLVNVHGHIHSHDIPDIGYINISVEKTGYAPIHIDELAELVKLESMKMEAQNVTGV